MSTMLQYKCPCCGGKIEFDSNLQQLKCPYCDTAFDAKDLKDYDEVLSSDEVQEEMQWQDPDSAQWDQSENVNLFICQSCGGEVIAEATTAATHCPYCGNPVILAGRLAGDLKPDFVIPFQLDKKAAKEALKKHLSGKKLLPKLFKDENHLDEIKGVYVPFWLFDAEADANVRYRATRIRTWSDSSYIYTETSHFALLRKGQISFSNVPTDGSSKMADDLMESIEPYDLSKAVDFQTAYLSGYLADRYDVAWDQSIERANQRIKKSTEEVFAATTVGYTSVEPQSTSIKLLHGKAKYALLPVWILNTTWQDQKYTFAMNGQTGKFVGNLPMDKGAYWRWWALWTAILGAGAFVVLLLLRLMGIL